MSRLPTRNQAAATPAATTRVTMSVITIGGSGGSWCSATPVTGARKSTAKSPTMSTPPRTERAASTISGTVMIVGDSCGCTPSSQRFSPKKVISISRVM